MTAEMGLAESVPQSYDNSSAPITSVTATSVRASATRTGPTDGVEAAAAIVPPSITLHLGEDTAVSILNKYGPVIVGLLAE